MTRARKILILLITVALIGFGYYWYKRTPQEEYLDIIDDGLGAERNANRDYSFLLTESNSFDFFNSFNPTVPLATNKVFKPWLLESDAAFSTSNRQQNKENAVWLKSMFDPIVTEVAKSVRLPRAIIYAVMLVETGSVARKANWQKLKYDQLVAANPSGATGPMQIKPITATETFQISLNKGLLKDYHSSVLLDTLGSVRSAQVYLRENPKSKYFKDNKIIGYDGYAAELRNDELNIMLGALKLINLIDNYGETNLHQVFYSYNQGDRTVLVYGLKKYTKPTDFINAVSGEGEKYVKRILGKDGALDIIINDLGIFE